MPDFLELLCFFGASTLAIYFALKVIVLENKLQKFLLFKGSAETAIQQLEEEVLKLRKHNLKKKED